MPKPKRRAKETRARGFQAPPKKPRAKIARARKPARSKTPLIDRLIAAAEGLESGKLKATRLTGLSDQQKLKLLSEPVIPEDD